MPMIEMCCGTCRWGVAPWPEIPGDLWTCACARRSETITAADNLCRWYEENDEVKKMCQESGNGFKTPQ